MEIKRTSPIREGKAKILFNTNHPDGLIIQQFKDDATAFNALKKGTIKDKGVINNTVSSWIFEYLGQQGIPTHYIDKLNDREMLVEPLEIIPVEVVVRNYAAGSICKRLGLEKGRELNPPLVEYFYKDDPLGDPLIGEGHIFYFQWATSDQLSQMREIALQVNRSLSKVFSEIGLTLVDYKLEFGTTKSGKLLLADEFTADGCRLWDKRTGESMDKDRFRHDMGNVEAAYQEVFHRLEKYFQEMPS